MQITLLPLTAGGVPGNAVVMGCVSYGQWRHYRVQSPDAKYMIVLGGTCHAPVTTKLDCESAAVDLGLSGTTAVEITDASSRPPSCFVEASGTLRFNTATNTSTSCSVDYQCLCLARASATATFAPVQSGNNAWELHAAVSVWCDNKTAAIARFGHVSEWDVAGVANFQFAFCANSQSYYSYPGGSSCAGYGYCCKAGCDFDEDLGSWQMTQATSLRYMFYDVPSFTLAYHVAAWAVTSNVAIFWGTFWGTGGLTNCSKAIIDESWGQYVRWSCSNTWPCGRYSNGYYDSSWSSSSVNSSCLSPPSPLSLPSAVNSTADGVDANRTNATFGSTAPPTTVPVLHSLSPADGPIGWLGWQRLNEDIAEWSFLRTIPGSTAEGEWHALVVLFNATCNEWPGPTATSPYRGAFAQTAVWSNQRGWETILAAHTSVPVQCRALYLEGGEEFAAKHCFWHIDTFERRIEYPTPQWTIVEDCCEALDRPLLRVNDAVWATTRGTWPKRAPPPCSSIHDTPRHAPPCSRPRLAPLSRLIPPLECVSSRRWALEQTGGGPGWR